MTEETTCIGHCGRHLPNCVCFEPVIDDLCAGCSYNVDSEENEDLRNEILGVDEPESEFG